MKVHICFTVGSIASIMFIHLKTVITERCAVESQLFPPHPPEFPDFMDAFKVTISQIGIESLWPRDQVSCSLNSCPSSVNWSAFNRHLCDGNPLDLDKLCETLTTTAESVFLSSVEDDSSSIGVENPVFELPTRISPDDGATTDGATTDGATTDGAATDGATTGTSSSTIHSTEDEGHEGVQLDNITELFQPEVTSLSDFPILSSSVLPNSVIPVSNGLLPSYTSPDNGSSSTAEAMTSDGGAHVAIGVVCGITLLCFCIIIFIIFFSQDRTCNLRGIMRRSMMKVFQRQRSDIQPLSYSPSGQPSTPLQDFHSDPMSANNNVTDMSGVETNSSSMKRHADVDLQPCNGLDIEMSGEKDYIHQWRNS